MSLNLPRIVIAGTHSGCGKTSVALGVMAALSRRGLAVQGFKVGPDYIDPGFQALATGRPGRNLDTFMVPGEGVLELFQRSASRAEVSVVEGVMGLFDGDQDGAASTAGVARLLSAPVVLVVDAASSAQSVAAVVLGFRSLDPGLRVAGVILNRLGSPSHMATARRAVEELAGVAVLGCLPRDPGVSLPSRHLGLVPAGEQGESVRIIDRLGILIERCLDLDALLSLATEAPAMEPVSPRVFAGPEVAGGPIVAVARDEAFDFYYQDALELLQHKGLQPVLFSPLRDGGLPRETAALYLGGGFPEEFLEPLAENDSMLQDIRQAVTKGMPMLAECGGMLYLCRELTDRGGLTRRLAGVLPAVGTMEPKLAGMGYRRATTLADSLLGPRGTQLLGHEFHYSSLKAEGIPNGMEFFDRRAGVTRRDGFASPHFFASYLHLHLCGNPLLAWRFADAARSFSRGESQ